MPAVQYHIGRYPPTRLDWLQLIPLLGPAEAAVARHDGMLAAVPNLICRPMFYTSGWLEARRDEYYERLLAVSRDDVWTVLCRLFIEAVLVQAEENLARTQAILKLYEDLKHRLPAMTRSQYAVRALDRIFARPIFSAPDFIQDAGVPAPTARRFLGVLRKARVLKDLRPGRGRRAGIFAFPALLNVAEGREVV